MPSILHTGCDHWLCVVISGVYLCKHADILQPSAFHNGQSGYLVVFKILKVNFYRLRRRGDNTFGSIRVWCSCVSVRLSVGAVLFEPFDLDFGIRVDLDLG